MNTNKRVEIKVQAGSLVAMGVSDPGRERSENEDAIYLDDAGQFLLLADGMGGHDRGAEASRLALDVIKDFFDPQLMSEELQDITDGGGVPSEIACIESLVDRAVTRANREVYERNRAEQIQRFMGTTVVGLVLVDTQYAIWFHVGDSRLYRWRGAELQCMTEDHSAYLEWERKGRIGSEPKKNVITRAIGPNPAVSPTTAWDSILSDDVYILCSDGLSDMISDQQIKDILASEADVEKVTRLLIEAANNAGGRDNISAVVCRF
jgi:protein phosphatase